MTKEIKTRKTELSRLLSKNSPDTDWSREAENLLIQIKFFQHERLVHLIVTMTMCLLTVITVCALFLSGGAPVWSGLSVAFMLLFVLFLGLTAAYLIHYYKLENGVQELYGYYNRSRERADQ